MFELIVLGYDEINSYIKRGWPTRIISVINENVPDFGEHHLHVVFDDVHRTDTKHLAPSSDHLEQILEFTKDLTDQDRVLVHCLAGISRSTAVAIGILIQHGMDWKDAYHHVKSIRPILSPNTLIIKYIDDRFSLNGELIQLAKSNERYPNLKILAV